MSFHQDPRHKGFSSGHLLRRPPNLLGGDVLKSHQCAARRLRLQRLALQQSVCSRWIWGRPINVVLRITQWRFESHTNSTARRRRLGGLLAVGCGYRRNYVRPRRGWHRTHQPVCRTKAQRSDQHGLCGRICPQSQSKGLEARNLVERNRVDSLTHLLQVVMFLLKLSLTTMA